MNNRGQNVVEYLLLVTAVLLVCVAAFGNGRAFRGAVQKDLDSIPLAIDRAANSAILTPPGY